MRVGHCSIPGSAVYTITHIYVQRPSESTTTCIYVLDTGEYHVPMHIQKLINTCQFNNSKYRKVNFGITPVKFKN